MKCLKAVGNDLIMTDSNGDDFRIGFACELEDILKNLKMKYDFRNKSFFEA